MSLINEALKKAQKQRTGETPEMPAVGGESAARIARRGQPAGLNALILRIGLGVVGLAVVIVGAVLILRRPAPAPVPPTTPPAASTAPVTTAPTAAQKPAETTSAITSLAAPQTPAAVVVPAAPATVPSPNPPASAPLATTVVFPSAEAPKPADTAPIQLAPAPAQPAAPTVVRKLDPRAINFINSIRVAGIRASANDSKVLMMDRVYRVGDLVEAEMGLKLAGITPNSLTFEDENGAKFTRNF